MRFNAQRKHLVYYKVNLVDKLVTCEWCTTVFYYLNFRTPLAVRITVLPLQRRFNGDNYIAFQAYFISEKLEDLSSQTAWIPAVRVLKFKLRRPSLQSVQIRNTLFISYSWGFEGVKYDDCNPCLLCLSHLETEQERHPYVIKCD